MTTVWKVGERRGGGLVNIGPPLSKFKTLFNKNEIKPEKGGLPWQFFLKALTPPRILPKTSGTPSPGFSTRVHLCMLMTQPISYSQVKF